MKSLFKNHAQELENNINKYLEVVSNSNLVFERDSKNYVKGNIEAFQDSLDEINKLENSADDFQKDIKYKLYKYMLIPEARGDVLSLLENIDNIVDHIKKLLLQFSIEGPYIPDSLENDFSELIEMVKKSVDVLIRCIRAYFNNISMVNEYVNKVHFYEHEADKIEERIKRKVFKNISLDDFSKKVHIRYFVEQITEISDRAETISERASVAAIKRRI
ncbi:MAG TPA: DUF47 family protein [Halanaerobiales bacterium]|nr:DUF47 family protein [Halanaerobiales bacterium]